MDKNLFFILLEGGGGLKPSSLIFGNDGYFYGTTEYGDAVNSGTVFKITSSGEESRIYSFSPFGSDGLYPAASLILGNDGYFYGTTKNGGTGNNGTVFKITSSGQETVVYSFESGPDGTNPVASLIEDSNNNFYGTTESGGANYGTVFKITNGVETVLHSFESGTDGANPVASLIMDSGGNLYGTTKNGGANGYGTVFEIANNESESILYSFESGADGANPVASLIMDSSGNLYGTTENGGKYSYGTVFMIASSGDETILHSFAGGPSDGANPVASLIIGNDGNFYGTTQNGGVNSSFFGYCGTVFELIPPM